MAATLPSVSTAFVVIAKRAYKPLVNDNDQLLISNWGAIRLGLEALLKEDASDFARAEELWQKAKDLLIKEEENLVGAGAEGVIQVQDDFSMATVGGDGWCGCWPWPGYGG